VWFSYRTPVGFLAPGTGYVVRENAWGPTTGKHLNYLNSNKAGRVSGEQFTEQLADALSHLGVTV